MPTALQNGKAWRGNHPHQCAILGCVPPPRPKRITSGLKPDYPSHGFAGIELTHPHGATCDLRSASPARCFSRFLIRIDHLSNGGFGALPLLSLAQ
ncbi:Uncharacterised protein [Vibrio cholerae]|nr:Uncharacterised protein [Vibrio cholerae]